MKAVFARYGIPDVLVTDNGPQFAAAEFAVFAKSWMFQHITSSPHYSQSNGKAENAVKTVKRLLTKCKESGQSEFLALLDWRNTPTEGVGTSPAQRLMGRRCKTLLPIASTLLQPRYSTDEESRAIMGKKERQRYYYNKHTKPLQPILQGETVRMKLPGQKVWSAGTCLGPVGPRSYYVRINGSVYRRNRRQLVSSKEPPIPEVTETITYDTRTIKQDILRPGNSRSRTSYNSARPSQIATNPQDPCSMERLCSPLTCEHLLLADAERYTNQNQLLDFFLFAFLVAP
ncbi:uncharacterized protein LOC122963306 [Acropora millepora]|uniref:uncharacterized protein LOC122963306 n=1 Tax=Acropora millepora TaxID=45264 RepID=UPI001CF23ECB|nr:uncharacterized protein LOC122963306 [Acropora millepora]